MATEQIQAQAPVVTPATNDKILVQQTIDGITRYMTPQQILDLIATIGQAEAEAGTSTTDRMWTAERVKQAIAALAPVTFKIPVLAKTANYTLTTSDIRKLIDSTSGTWTLTLPPANTAGDGFWFSVRNSGSGVVTIDPDAAELIDGAATITLSAGESLFVVGNAAAWKTIGRAGSPSQNVVTGSRALATTYQNTTGRPLHVTVTLRELGGSAAAASFEILTDAATPPTTVVAEAYVPDEVWAPVSFDVLPGNYYRINQTGGGGTGAIKRWTEWT